MFKRLSLQVKIIVIFAASVAVVLAVSTLTATWLTRDPVEEELYHKALAQARLTAHELGARDMLRKPDVLLATLRQMQHDMPGVVQADVFAHDTDHPLVATTNPRGQHLEVDHLPNVETYNLYNHPNDDQESIETGNRKFWIISTRISEPDASGGCLDLTVSRSSLNAVTWDLVQRNLLLMVGSLVGVILVIHLFFLQAVRRPIKEMIRVMEAAEGGQLDVRARLQSWDEIGFLAAHLNRMLRRIENFNSELGRKVQEATAGLGQANEELRRINEELFETQKKLARSERLAVAGQLAASLAHEIGTPLNSISGHVQLLARRKGADESTTRRLQIIEKQIDNIVRTVKQLLSWSRKFELRIEMVELRRVIEEAALLSSPALQVRNIKIELDLAKNCPTIYGDAGYLQQVFLNLINNSMDAMLHGGELRIEMRRVEGEAREIAVRVIDNGVGMPPETVAHIFDPMFTTKRMGTGTGLGLAICDQIIRQHGGNIRAESTPGQGTTFMIVLPFDCREKAETVAVAAESSLARTEPS